MIIDNSVNDAGDQEHFRKILYRIIGIYPVLWTANHNF